MISDDKTLASQDADPLQLNWGDDDGSYVENLLTPDAVPPTPAELRDTFHEPVERSEDYRQPYGELSAGSVLVDKLTAVMIPGGRARNRIILAAVLPPSGTAGYNVIRVASEQAYLLMSATSYLLVAGGAPLELDYDGPVYAIADANSANANVLLSYASVN
jgi:hypothetical protein